MIPSTCSTPQETEAHAEAFTKFCSAGTVIRLHGTLGAGKTTWTRGFVRAFNSSDQVSSPSFSLLNEYHGPQLTLYHWDLYRLDSSTDWSLLDLPDHLPSDGITLIEWPDRYPGPWPTSNLFDVTLKPSPQNPEIRSIEVSPSPS